jgi:hypothetical protein
MADFLSFVSWFKTYYRRFGATRRDPPERFKLFKALKSLKTLPAFATSAMTAMIQRASESK